MCIINHKISSKTFMSSGFFLNTHNHFIFISITDNKLCNFFPGNEQGEFIVSDRRRKKENFSLFSLLLFFGAPMLMEKCVKKKSFLSLQRKETLASVIYIHFLSSLTCRQLSIDLQISFPFFSPFAWDLFN